MGIPTLVVTDPPHGEVAIEAAAELLGLDVFAAGLKASFVAPEVMSAGTPEEAAEFAAALSRTGFSLATLDGAVLRDLPWPDPLSSLVFDDSQLRGTVSGQALKVSYETEVVAVFCQPPADRQSKAVDPARAVASDHGPTIADAIQRTSILDLYFQDGGALRRASIVPELLELDGQRVVKELARRFKSLRLDTRLVGVRPRAPFILGVGFDVTDRRRYSFGTAMLREVLESISTELGTVPQYEFGSRLAYALSPLGAAAESG